MVFQPYFMYQFGSVLVLINLHIHLHRKPIFMLKHTLGIRSHIYKNILQDVRAARRNNNWREIYHMQAEKEKMNTDELLLQNS